MKKIYIYIARLYESYNCANVRGNSDARQKRYLNRWKYGRGEGGGGKGGRGGYADAECEDEKLQECYYRHELPKGRVAFSRPVGNVPPRFARVLAFCSLPQTRSIFYVEMQREIASRGADTTSRKTTEHYTCEEEPFGLGEKNKIDKVYTEKSNVTIGNSVTFRCIRLERFEMVSTYSYRVNVFVRAHISYYLLFISCNQ